MIQDPSFYLAVSFVLFLGVFGKTFLKKIKSFTSGYAAAIEHQMGSVAELYKEAQDLLKQKEAELGELQKRIHFLEEDTCARILEKEILLTETLIHLEKIAQDDLKRAKDSLRKEVESVFEEKLLEKIRLNVENILIEKISIQQKRLYISSLLENWTF